MSKDFSEPKRRAQQEINIYDEFDPLDVAKQTSVYSNDGKLKVGFDYRTQKMEQMFGPTGLVTYPNSIINGLSTLGHTATYTGNKTIEIIKFSTEWEQQYTDELKRREQARIAAIRTRRKQ